MENRKYSMKYTIGIAEIENSFVFIRKQRPAWQNNRLNFVGGKVESLESNLDCMIREFREETGVQYEDWKHIGCLWRKFDFEINVFYAKSDIFKNVKTITDEEIMILTLDEIRDRKDRLPNLLWMLEFVKSNDFLSYPLNFNIEYGEFFNDMKG